MKKGEQPKFSDLEKWSEDLQARLMVIRGAVCDPSAEVTGDQMFCAVE